MDNVEVELYAMYAVYCHRFDPITRKVDLHSPAQVVALVTSSSIVDCIIEVYNNAFPGISFYKELDHTQRIEVDFTPLPFEWGVRC